MESFENPIHLVARYVTTRVRDNQLEVLARSLTVESNHRAWIGEPNRIAKQMCQHLMHAGHIRREFAADDAFVEMNSGLFCARSHRLNRSEHSAGNVACFARRRGGFRFEPAEIEDVADEPHCAISVGDGDVNIRWPYQRPDRAFPLASNPSEARMLVIGVRNSCNTTAMSGPGAGRLLVGKVVQPVRTMLPVAEHQGFLGLMPAYTGQALGAKLVAFYPRNTGLPTHHAIIQLFRPETGEPLATIDGRLITEMRTAAVSAVATKFLAHADAALLAILGSGVQARSHLEAWRLVRTFGEVRVWSPRHATEFANEFGVNAPPSAEAAVRGADVVVTATTSQTPVLCGAWLSPGVHINAVGDPRPDWRELDDEVLSRARLYVDSREAAAKESGDVIAAGLHRVVGELGEVAAGALPRRQSSDEITLFKSLGLAVENVATAEFVYRKALGARSVLGFRAVVGASRMPAGASATTNRRSL